ncbi:MAG: flagellar basal-body MS-ring/collar protein FliF [Bacteriovoracales bacterium]|nr:flagellar basal-body MS-ring/collar protein FliF [Bacteriovoracales bacterium]
MNEQSFQRIIGNFKIFFDSLETSKKIGMISVFVIIVIAMISIVAWISRTEYKYLYKNLNSEDASQIARILEEKKISYLLVDDGKTIKIPIDQVEIWRLELAKMGMRFTGTVGYEVFDNQPFGTTSFVQKINKQRALEGELVKTIMHIEGVKRARVHLSIPETSPFVSEVRAPSASVILDLNRGTILNEQEIRGVAMLVSSSIDGMRPENVVILDSRGKKLSENIGDQITIDTANRIALEGKMNRKLEKQVEEIVSKVAGKGRVIAKVAVDLDFTESVSTETVFDSENSAVLSQVENKELLEGSRPSPQGIPGARSNLPGEKPQPGIPETKNNVDKNLKTTNYNVPSKVTKSRNPTAKIKKMSVAVMIDSKQVPELGENKKPILSSEGFPKTKSIPWSENEIENFKAIVASTLGINAARGDSIVIRHMEFAKEDLASIEAFMKQRERRELLKNIIKYVTIGLIMTLFFFIVVRPFILWITENNIESVEDFLPKTIEELEKIQANQKLPGLEEALPQLEEKLNPEKIEGEMLKEKIITLVESDPAKVAQVIHSMIYSSDAEERKAT